MAYSGIGGQAVIEGIMMRSGDEYSLGVRTGDGNIVVTKHPYKSVIDVPALKKIPLVRGVIAFIDSLSIGISTLMESASYFEEEEESEEEKARRAALTEEQRKAEDAKAAKAEKAMMTGTLIFSVVIVVALFMMLPYFISAFIGRFITARWLISLIEAVLRVGIFVIYLVLISRMKDIQRTFMYHGAEHKCINCIEHGMDLTVENVMKSSRFHKRCGTSFLFFVVIVSAVLLMFVQAESHIMRVVIRLLLVPVIAGISFEIIRLAGQADTGIMAALSKPGLAMQKLTTREPDETQAEVAIAAVEAVFDWRAFLEKQRQEEEKDRR